MPQIAQLSQTYASQIFWVLLVFGFVFFVVGRGMVPRVMATVSTRDTQIANDLAAAESARKAADAEEEAWKAHHNQQRAEAQAIIAKAKADATRATEIKLAGASTTIDARISAAEQRIAAARDGALGEIENVATEAASDIVTRVAGVSVSSDAARAAVKEALHG
jgi:F-type H+-transporting ATPase subunit b